MSEAPQYTTVDEVPDDLLPLKQTPEKIRIRRDIVHQKMLDVGLDFNISEMSRQAGVDRTRIYADVEYILENCDVRPETVEFTVYQSYLEVLDTAKELTRSNELKEQKEGMRRVESVAEKLIGFLERFGYKEKAKERHEVEQSVDLGDELEQAYEQATQGDD